METKDCSGNILNEGDAVHTNKTLKVKGSSIDIKMGTVIKNIRLTSNPEEVECKIGKSTIVLKTMFLKKKN
jgi:protein PhnA